jgi:hypothetical protein
MNDGSTAFPPETPMCSVNDENPPLSPRPPPPKPPPPPPPLPPQGVYEHDADPVTPPRRLQSASVASPSPGPWSPGGVQEDQDVSPQRGSLDQQLGDLLCEERPCPCGKEQLGTQICCDTCNRWYHAVCARMTRAEVEKLDPDTEWLCSSDFCVALSMKSLSDPLNSTSASDIQPPGSPSPSQAFGIASPPPLRRPVARKQSAAGGSASLHSDVGGSRRNKPRVSDAPRPSEPVYCLCRKEHGGAAMIICDVCAEWYHLECLQRPFTEIPVRAFSCPPCTRAQSWIDGRVKPEDTVTDWDTVFDNLNVKVPDHQQL